MSLSSFPYQQGSECLHKGRHRVVYSGHHKVTKQPIIWKEFDFAINEFNSLNEIRLQTNLTHPYIEPVLAYTDIHSDEFRFQFVMVFERYPYVLETLSSQGLTEEQIVDIVGMTISGLAHMESVGVAHRDIKPENIFLTAEGQVRIGDFGTAKEYALGLQTYAGSPAYFSPILRRQKWSHHNPFKSDVYSLGLSALQLSQSLSTYDFRDLFPLTELPNLPSTILNLPHSPAFKHLLTSMLQFEERNRPDFTQLMYIFLHLWPEKRHLFINETLKNCENCGNLADFMCICRENLPSFCENCRNEHESKEKEHVFVKIHEINQIKNTELKNRLKIRDKIAKNVKLNIEKMLNSVKKCENERILLYNDWISRLEALKSSEISQFHSLSDRLTSLISTIDHFYLEERLKDTLLFDTWADIPPPYVDLTVSEPSDSHPFGQIHLNDSKIANFEEENRALGLLFLGKTVYYTCLLSNEHVKVLEFEGIQVDSGSSVTLIGRNGAVGCGGRERKRQLFEVDRERVRMGSLRQDYVSPVLCHVAGEVYVFGTGKEARYAEVITTGSLCTRALPLLPTSLSPGSACEHLGDIYLPAVNIYIYRIQSEIYEKILSLQVDYGCLLVFREKLYVFMKNDVYEKTLKSDSPIIHRCLPDKFSIDSLPNPIIIGNTAFFFSSATLKILKTQLN